MKTISKDPEKSLHNYIDEQAEQAKIKYLESWSDDFSSLQSGEERQAQLLLAGYLLTIADGYNKVEFHAAWGAHCDPEWGTVMGFSVEVGGHLADFLFRVCYGDDRRYLELNSTQITIENVPQK